MSFHFYPMADGRPTHGSAFSANIFHTVSSYLGLGTRAMLHVCVGGDNTWRPRQFYTSEFLYDFRHRLAKQNLVRRTNIIILVLVPKYLCFESISAERAVNMNHSYTCIFYKWLSALAKSSEATFNRLIEKSYIFGWNWLLVFGISILRLVDILLASNPVFHRRWR